MESSPAPSCPVCGEPAVGGMSCPVCATQHHGECWEYNRGCSVYGCREGPGWRSAPDPGESGRPAGKILLAHMGVGRFDGFFFVPYLAGALTILCELVWLLAPALGRYALSNAGFLGMWACVLWIALSSERHYLDLDRRALTRAKAILGFELAEWVVWPLARVKRLALVPEPSGRSYLLAAVDREDSLLPLAPAVRRDDPAFAEILGLLARLKANNVFPVEVPRLDGLPADEDAIRILDHGTPVDPGPGDPRDRGADDPGTPTPPTGS